LLELQFPIVNRGYKEVMLNRVDHCASCFVDYLNNFSCVDLPAEVTEVPLVAVGGGVTQGTFPAFVQEGLDILKEMQKGESGSLFEHVVLHLSALLRDHDNYLSCAEAIDDFLSSWLRRLLKGIFNPLQCCMQRAKFVTQETEASWFQQALDSLKEAKSRACRLIYQNREGELWVKNVERYLCEQVICGTLREVVVRTVQCGTPSEHSLVDSLIGGIDRCEDLKFSTTFFEKCLNILADLSQEFAERNVDRQTLFRVQNELQTLQAHVDTNYGGEVHTGNDEKQRKSLNQTMRYLENIMGNLEKVYEQICQVWLLKDHDIYPSLQEALLQLISQVGEESVGNVLKEVLKAASCNTVSGFMKRVLDIASKQKDGRDTEAWTTRWAEIRRRTNPLHEGASLTGRRLEDIEKEFRRMSVQLCWSPTLEKMNQSGIFFLCQVAGRVRNIIDFYEPGTQVPVSGTQFSPPKMQGCAEAIKDELIQCIGHNPCMCGCKDWANLGQFSSDDEDKRHRMLAEQVQTLIGHRSDQRNNPKEEERTIEHCCVLPTPGLYPVSIINLKQSLEKLRESSNHTHCWAEQFLRLYPSCSGKIGGREARRLVQLFVSWWPTNENLKAFDRSCGEPLRIAWSRNKTWILDSKTCYMSFIQCITDMLSSSMSDVCVNKIQNALNNLKEASSAYIDCAKRCQKYVDVLQGLVGSCSSCATHAQELMLNLEELACLVGDLQYGDEINQHCQKRGELCETLCANVPQQERKREDIQQQESLLKKVIDEWFICLLEESPQEKALKSIWDLFHELMSLGQHELSKNILQLLTDRSLRRGIVGEQQNDFIQIAMRFSRVVISEEGVG